MNGRMIEDEDSNYGRISALAPRFNAALRRVHHRMQFIAQKQGDIRDLARESPLHTLNSNVSKCIHGGLMQNTQRSSSASGTTETASLK